MQKRLTRSTHDRMLAGVCGGVADFLGWDPSVVRIVWIVLTMLGGSGVLLYLILWLVMPQES
ncbi:MAG: PspC domain-containing protein [Rhodanobacter sp.]|nr:MAG: PspC domain-containing protein [Rhodanobacter sp.]TAM08665.1 MAG: PspC domain-containing protein [Rhodanobacter sp.]TAM36171.1 MAG: PspC domain-containing protein [Rhodanobacter sp.]